MPHISNTLGLSFELKRIGPLAALVATLVYLLALLLSAVSNTTENLSASFYSELLIQITCQHLLLLVGFDTLIYRKYYDTPPILVGHQSSVAFLVLYVDDILLIGNDMELLKSAKEYLNSKFSMKDLRETAYVLGTKIYRDRPRRLLALCQSTYLDKILKKFNMHLAKKSLVPVVKGKH